MSVKTVVHLTDAELALLDGQCSEKVQAEVVRALGRIEAVRTMGAREEIARFVADAVHEARSKRRLIYRRKTLSRCRACDRVETYAPFRSGPRKGQPNHKRPIPFRGYELADRLVVMVGHAIVGCCEDCMDEARPFLRGALREVAAEVPEQIRAEDAPAYRLWRLVECTECGWQGHEGEIPKGRNYGGWVKCPACDRYQSYSGPLRHRDGEQLVLEEPAEDAGEVIS